MVSKIITTVGKAVGKKVGGEILKKSFDTLDYLNNRIWTGSRELNIGEEESLNCYKYMPQDKTGFCDSVGNSKREQYHHPWRLKK